MKVVKGSSTDGSGLCGGGVVQMPQFHLFFNTFGKAETAFCSVTRILPAVWDFFGHDCAVFQNIFRIVLFLYRDTLRTSFQQPGSFCRFTLF